MGETEFTARGVRIGRWLRSVTRAGQILIRNGRLELLTSVGTEIDSAPLERVQASTPWYAPGRALAIVDGTRYLLTLGSRDPAPGEPGPPAAGSFLTALRQARGRAETSHSWS